MPIYQYTCSDCKTQVDKIKKFSEMDEKEICTGCNLPMIRILSISSPPQFKGTGFYSTDYKKKT